jgi:DNA polymerase elongation subunit (family B)
MYKKLFLDIETIGTSRPDVIDYIATSVKPPATYKKPESIAEWYREQGPAAIAEAVAKTGLDGAFGQVVCIGYQLDDMESPFVLRSLNERSLLEQFFKTVTECIDQKDVMTTSVIGHNIAGFDLRFLMQRYMVNGIRPPFVIKRAAEAKPWESDKVYDTMIQFAGVGNRISLDKLCLALNVPSPKGDMDGSMVGQAVKDGRLEEVAEYCKRDVEATKEVFERMTFTSSTEVQMQFEDVTT